MNKYDRILVFLVLLLVSFFFIMRKEEKGKLANVYYASKLVLQIDLTTPTKSYVVKGELGDVTIVAGDGSIFVEKETSPRHLCSKQGKITSPHEKIVCLPNKIVIEIKSDEEYDTVLK